MDNTQLLILLVTLLSGVVSGLAGLVCLLVLHRITKVEEGQEKMKADWLGAEETNAMVSRVETDFMHRYNQYEDRLKEFKDEVKKEINSCSNHIIKQVTLAMRLSAGEKVKFEDVLDPVILSEEHKNR